MERIACFVLGVAAFAAAPASAADRDAALVGLWEAVRVFGPEIKGTLLFLERDGKLVADISGFSVPIQLRGDSYNFELPDDKGAFRGRRVGNEIHGFWIQPRNTTGGTRYSSTVTLRRDGRGWRGDVVPLEDRYSVYLPVTRSADGTLATYFRNPERNDGVFSQVQSLEVTGDHLKLVGNRRGSKEPRTAYEGGVRDETLFVDIPGRGGMFSFHKVDDDASSAFFPRGRSPGKYRYTPPLQRDDGWPTAAPEDVGLSRAALEAMVQKIVDTPMSSLSSSQIHSVLIARHGRLVLDEYFHGYHRDRPHETRSASKSLSTVLIGAAMQAGTRIGPDTPVYETMLGPLPANIDPRKRAMKLEHLLTMTGGHFCDDGNDDAPGNENTMQEQDKERDWYRFILALPMDRTPGEKIIYCSIDAHLSGGVLAKVAGEPIPELFDRLVARPLGFGQYHFFLAPLGEAYLGGGAQLLPRDFLKIAQLMLNDGMWQGRRIVSREWARKSTAPLRDLVPGRQYGYLWHSVEYPYRDRKVRAFFAAGNGGQIFMGIPDLDLAIAFTGGNYADAALFIPQRVIVPEQILPAVN